MFKKKSNRARIYYTKHKMCCPMTQYLLVRTNYLIEKRNRIFLVSAWWWSSTLNVTMPTNSTTYGVPTPPHTRTDKYNPFNKFVTEPMYRSTNIGANHFGAIEFDSLPMTMMVFMTTLVPTDDERTNSNCGGWTLADDVDDGQRCWWMDGYEFYRLTKQTPKTPAIQDDADGHLIYHTNDILHNRCSW